MPKSSTLTSPSRLSRTFFGLMSPWMMPRMRRSSSVAWNWWAFSRKSQISMAIQAASSAPSGARAIRSARSSPSTYSMSM